MMKLYWRGKIDNSIDILVELCLKAYIAEDGSFAIITISDSTKSVENLLKEFFITNVEVDEVIDIYFTPQGVITGLSYLIGREETQQKYQELIDTFCTEFYKEILSIAEEKNDIERQEAVRFVWKIFDSESQPTKQGVNSDKISSHISNEIKQLLHDSMLWIKKSFLELCIKYAIYITMWERTYGPASVAEAIGHNMSHKEDMGTGKERLKKIDKYCNQELYMARSTFYYNFQKKIGEDKVKQVLSEENILKEVMLIENSIYDGLEFQKILDVEKKYRKFFYYDKDAIKNGCFGIYELYCFYNIFKTDIQGGDRKKLFDLFLCDNAVEVDLTWKVLDELMVAAEVVLMNVLIINKAYWNEDDNVQFKDMVNRIQFVILPYLQAIADTEQDNQIFQRIVSMDDRSKIEELLSNYDEEMEYFREKKTDLYGFFDKRDQYSIMGTAFMHASRYYSKNELHNSDSKKIRARAKNKANVYWRMRMKGLKYEKYKNPCLGLDDIDILKRFSKYIQLQNTELKKVVRNSLIKLYA